MFRRDRKSELKAASTMQEPEHARTFKTCKTEREGNRSGLTRARPTIVYPAKTQGIGQMYSQQRNGLHIAYKTTKYLSTEHCNVTYIDA